MPVADAWLIEDDSTVDEVALDIAAKGTRPVRLTQRERVIAALIIQSQHRECYCHASLDSHAFLRLVYLNLWAQLPSEPWSMTAKRPPPKAAAELVASLPTGAKAANLVRRWTDPAFRHAERERLKRYRQTRKGE